MTTVALRWLFLVVSLLAVVLQSSAAVRLLRGRLAAGATGRAQRGLLRTAACRVGAALLYVTVAVTGLAAPRTGFTISVAVFTAVQALWIVNGVLDVRLRRRLDTHPVPPPPIREVVMSRSIYDELAEKYGLQLDPPTQVIPAVRPSPVPRTRMPDDLRDAFALVHRHLDEGLASVHALGNRMEQVMSQALDNLTAQVSAVNDGVTALSGAITGTVEPALVELAAAAANGSSGVSDSDIQAVADNVATIASQVTALGNQLSTAASTALQQAGIDTSGPVAQPVTATPG